MNELLSEYRVPNNFHFRTNGNTSRKKLWKDVVHFNTADDNILAENFIPHANEFVLTKSNRHWSVFTAVCRRYYLST